LHSSREETVGAGTAIAAGCGSIGWQLAHRVSPAPVAALCHCAATCPPPPLEGHAALPPPPLGADLTLR